MARVVGRTKVHKGKQTVRVKRTKRSRRSKAAEGLSSLHGIKVKAKGRPVPKNVKRLAKAMGLRPKSRTATSKKTTGRGMAWWKSLTKRQQTAYLKEHPNSKYGKKDRAGRVRKNKAATKKQFAGLRAAVRKGTRPKGGTGAVWAKGKPAKKRASRKAKIKDTTTGRTRAVRSAKKATSGKIISLMDGIAATRRKA